MSSVTGNGPAAFSHWIELYERAYLEPKVLTSLRCPACGALALRLVFVVRSFTDQEGQAAFWCDHCLHGIALAPAPVPLDADVRLLDEGAIPDYAVVAPTSK